LSDPPIDPDGVPAIRVLFSGFGRVARTLTEILVRREDFPGLAGAPPIEVIGITTGGSGALVDPEGLDLERVLEEVSLHGRFTTAHPGAAALDTATAARVLDYDVLVEMSPLTVAGRGEPARSYVRTALERGRHAVSANKGPVAWGYRELSRLAAERGVSFLFESTVMDGAPVFCLRDHCLPGASLERVEGVLSSTTNVILSAMEEGLGFDEALERAREAGVVEADPEDDLAGWDAAVKLACLANVLMGADLAPEDVVRTDVREIDPERVAEVAGRSGDRAARVKLVARAVRAGSGVAAGVEAEEVPQGDPLAQVAGTGSALRLVTDLPGRLVVVEEAPDLRTTAYGVLADLLRLPPR
jgi:homoserine dehydrogenase